jgi:hypothetical protein
MQRSKRESKSPRQDSLTHRGEIFFFLACPNKLPHKIDVVCINDGNVKQLLVRRYSEIVSRHGE